MSIRGAIERLALADAQRFETHIAGMLRTILEACREAATRAVIEEILAEEEDHLHRLDALVPAGVRETRREPAADVKEMPPLQSGSVCEMLREVLKKEKASVTFYELLAERTPVQAIKRAFRQIAEAEKGHVARLTEQVRRICADEETPKT